MVARSGYANVESDRMNQSTTLARTIVRQIIEAGITDVVISPGSRNAPLSIAFYQASTRDLIKLHTRIDERGAAFFALGLAKATGRAVPIVCTSGTAVANYHPAVLEAHHSNTPLLVLTADRPATLRKTGANQTTLQAGIFGKVVRHYADISGAAYPMELPLHAVLKGPVHLNIQFEEPLLPEDRNDWLSAIKIAPMREYGRITQKNFSTKSTRGVLVIGHDRGGLSVEEVTTFARELAWPVIAEDPLSFPDAISHASLFLTSTTLRKELAPHTVVVIGRTTLSRSINALVASAAQEIVIDPRMETVDTDRKADQKFLRLPTVSAPMADEEWLEKWAKIAVRAEKLVEDQSGWHEPLIARTIAAQIKNGTSLFIASSRPIRDIEGFALPRTGVETFANRGLAGIDGNISTAMGISHARTSTIAVLGDLSFLHDVSALVNHGSCDLTIFVINNDGGGIFSTLPQRGVDGFEEVFGTPHGRDIAQIAKSFGIESKKIATMPELIAELGAPIKGLRVVEIVVGDREANADFIKKVYAGVESM